MPDYYSSGRDPRRGYDERPRAASARPASGYPAGSARSAGARPVSSRSGSARPANARPASPVRQTGYSSARPTGTRPSGSVRQTGYNSQTGYSGRPSQGRGPAPRRRKKRAQPKLFIFAAILVVIIALILILSGGSGDNKPVQPQATPTAVPQSSTAMNNATIGTNDTASQTEPVPAQNDETQYSTLGDYLDTEDAGLANLDKTNVDISNLSINESLPDSWLNVLLLGTDERTLSENSRTDTMMICSINKNTGAVKLSSIMRDTAFTIGNVGSKYDGQTFRINAASYFGGPKYAMKVVNELLDMNIQYYVMVNFFGFQKIAQALGGIDLDITEAEMKEINKLAIQQAYIGERAGVDESDLLEANVRLETFGENTHLNGRQALAYARIRKLDSDASRTGRQQAVLQQLLSKMKQKSASEILILATSMFSNIGTNMDFNDIMSIANTVLQNGSLELDSMRLPINGSYKQESRNNQSMLYDTDWKNNALELYNFIYS